MSLPLRALLLPFASTLLTRPFVSGMETFVFSLRLEDVARYGNSISFVAKRLG